MFNFQINCFIFSYSDSSNKLSFILRDQTETPLERAVYWTEFVLRHNGASHLRLGSRSLLPYQRALVDVYAVLFSVAVLPLVLLYFCLRCCCSRKSGSVDLPKKNQWLNATSIVGCLVVRNWVYSSFEFKKVKIY